MTVVDLPSPADVPVGHVVEVVLRGHRHTSEVMAPALASALREQLREQVRNIGASYGLIEFTTHSGRAVSVRAREIVDITAGPPRAKRDRRVEVVHVHLHLSAPADDQSRGDLEEAAEAALGSAPIDLVPTPAAMARFPRRPR